LTDNLEFQPKSDGLLVLNPKIVLMMMDERRIIYSENNEDRVNGDYTIFK
jgi:hypothetical protein